MRLIRALVMTIGIIAILATFALLLGYYLYSLSPEIHSRLTPVAVSAEAAESFDIKLKNAKAEIETAVSAGQNKELTLSITDKEVNSKVTQIKAKGELPARELLINFGDGYFLTYAVVDTPGVNAKIGAIGRVEVVNGIPKIVITDFNLGKLPLPKTINGRVEQILNIMVSLQLADVSLDITNVQIKNHQLIIIGTTKTGK